MANGFGTLYVGTTGLQGAQNALNVTANNLANLDTKGYVRQQVRFADKTYAMFKDAKPRIAAQQAGYGVSIGDVVHARDIFIDKAYRQECGRLSFYSTFYDTTLQVENLLQELNGREFKEGITNLWQSFQELSKSPADSTNQNLVVQKAEVFVARCQSLYDDLKSYQGNLNTKIQEGVDRINKIGNEIFRLNLEVQRIEAGNVETAMTHRDLRDALIDELSQYANIEVSEDPTGYITIEIEGVEFIDESSCHNIGLHAALGNGFYTPYWPQISDVTQDNYVPVFKTTGPVSADLGNDVGMIKALLIARGDGYGNHFHLESAEEYKGIENSTMMQVQAQIDFLFHEICTAINDTFCPNVPASELFADGNYPAGVTADTLMLDINNCAVGVDGTLPPRELFERVGSERYTTITVDGKDYYIYNEEDPSDSSTLYAIGSVRINEEVAQQVTLLPAYTQNGAVDYEMAKKLADVWDKKYLNIDPSDNLPCNYTSFYDKMVSNIGIAGNTYGSATETLDSTVISLDNQRLQVMGVSSDEELTHMVKFQSAYNAASRFITVISEMTELIVTGLI